VRSSTPGDKIRILFVRRNKTREVEVDLSQETERSFAITPLPSPGELQSEIRSSWPKGP
jgi:hypothetical protein